MPKKVLRPAATRSCGRRMNSRGPACFSKPSRLTLRVQAARAVQVCLEEDEREKTGAQIEQNRRAGAQRHAGGGARAVPILVQMSHGRAAPQWRNNLRPFWGEAFNAPAIKH